MNSIAASGLQVGMPPSKLAICTPDWPSHPQSLPVFTLAHLLGFDLMPRIRNWKGPVFYRPSADSVRKGVISSSTLLKRLRSGSHKTATYAAFREVGRVIRTVQLLRYLTDETTWATAPSRTVINARPGVGPSSPWNEPSGSSVTRGTTDSMSFLSAWRSFP
ncbi:Tn3 family transposase [Kitasatospora sp. NPDC017646]|uniref:Tn3 family transposase n=1 Tax=Kitasatospora sp. NPDC017646 TaxID=3364024 RepID=UPI0037AD829B